MRILLVGAGLVFALGDRYGIWPPVVLAAIGVASFAAAWPWKRDKE